MMQLTPSQITLLNILGDGLCHSGSELGQALGITRSAIWKHVKQLLEVGVPIKSIPQQGYQLNKKLILLNEEQINNSLHEKQLSSPFNLHLFTSIKSTNCFLKEITTFERVEICCAEVQTQGRGRFGRHWHSPFGENIYCSSRWNLNCDLSKLSGLSLITSLAIRAALSELQLPQEIKIKWPNDLYWQDKKLCGSLIEIIAESNNNAQVIIGIGLNVNSDTANAPILDKPWCSLYEITQQYYDRNKIIAALISNLEHYLSLFLQHDLAIFMDEWMQADYLAGKDIKVAQATEILQGKACGINYLGQLILEDAMGKMHMLSSGDTSLNLN